MAICAPTPHVLPSLRDGQKWATRRRRVVLGRPRPVRDALRDGLAPALARWPGAAFVGALSVPPATLGSPDEVERIIVTTDVALSPALPTGVVDDLPALATEAAAALRSKGCLLMFAALDNVPLGVEIDGDLDKLLTLVAHTTPLLVYFDSRAWTAEDVQERRENLVPADDTHGDLAGSSAAIDASVNRLGEPAVLTISVVVGGVVHAFIFLAHWYFRVGSEQLRVAGQRRERAEQDWVQESEDDQQERLRAELVLVGLADTLLQDESFLRQSSDDARRLRARELVAPLISETLIREASIRGAIAAAARTAGARRASEVVPTRTATLRERLPDLAGVLASDPDFAAATTKNVRERCARALLTSTDPVVPPTPLIAALVAAALAQYEGQTLLG